MALASGLLASLDFVVAPEDTAEALGSGEVPVLATPRLLAWLEAATVAALDGHLEPGKTSVGTRAAIEHLRPTSVGRALRVTATVLRVDGRLVVFDVGAHETGSETGAGDGAGAMVGHGTITRAVVDRERFLARI